MGFVGDFAFRVAGTIIALVVLHTGDRDQTLDVAIAGKMLEPDDSVFAHLLGFLIIELILLVEDFIGDVLHAEITQERSQCQIK